MKIELTKERRIVIVISALVIIAIGAFTFLYRPIATELKEVYLEYKRYEREILRARNIIAGSKATGIKRTLITEEDISLAIDELTKQGKLKKVNFISMTPQQIEKRKDSRYKILPIEIEIESTYERLGFFLSSLDDFKKSAITIRGFRIIPDKKNLTKLKTNLVVNMYLSGEDAE